MQKEKRILVDYKVKSQLLELGTYPTIRKALDGDASTPQKINIRNEAIRLGGVIQEIQNNTQNEETRELNVLSV